MRQTYLVAYDVSDAKRLRKVFKLMRSYGDHVQLSVFRCELSARELLELRAKLGTAIHHKEDQVLFVDVGPADGRGNVSWKTLGRPMIVTEQRALVV